MQTAPMSLLDIDGLAPVSEKRARIGRPADEILGPIERDVSDTPYGVAARKLLLDVGLAERGESLADTLRSQAASLDKIFTRDPQAVIAATLEA